MFADWGGTGLGRRGQAAQLFGLKSPQTDLVKPRHAFRIFPSSVGGPPEPDLPVGS